MPSLGLRAARAPGTGLPGPVRGSSTGLAFERLPELRHPPRTPDAEKLQASPSVVRDVDLRTTGVEGRAVLALADAFDANTERLNRQLYGPHDYAVVAWKR